MVDDFCRVLLTDLLVNCIERKCPEYTIHTPTGHWKQVGLTKQRLVDVIVKADVMNDSNRPLSELILQRKITDKDDQFELALDVKSELLKNGMRLLRDLEVDSRESG